MNPEGSTAGEVTPTRRVPYFRIYMFAQTASGFGGVMAAISVIFVTLQITDGSTRWVATVEAVQYIPILLLARHAGKLVDRYPRRNLLLATQTLQAFSTTLLGLTFIFGYAKAWPLVLFAGFQGMVQSVDIAARQVFITDLLGVDGFQQGIASYNAVFGLGRMLAPVAAGWLIENISAGTVFIVNGISFAPVIVTLMIKSPRAGGPAPKPAGRDPGGPATRSEFTGTLRSTLPIMVLVAFVGALGYQFPTTNALMVRSYFHSTPSAYGILGGLVAAGGIAGSTWVRCRPTQGMKTVYVAALTLGLIEAAALTVSHYWQYAILLPFAGFAVSAFTACAMSAAQRSVEAADRGTSMTIYNASYIGFVPIGTLFIGFCADNLGARSALAVPGTLVAACAVGVYVWNRTRKSIALEPGARRGLPGERRGFGRSGAAG